MKIWTIYKSLKDESVSLRIIGENTDGLREVVEKKEMDARQILLDEAISMIRIMSNPIPDSFLEPGKLVDELVDLLNGRQKRNTAWARNFFEEVENQLNIKLETERIEK